MKLCMGTESKCFNSSTSEIDYILDERARELCLEEQRSITLCRLGKFVSRLKLYNPYSAPFALPHHELMPIPLNTIQANLGAVMLQNPG